MNQILAQNRFSGKRGSWTQVSANAQNLIPFRHTLAATEDLEGINCAYFYGSELLHTAKPFCRHILQREAFAEAVGDKLTDEVLFFQVGAQILNG